MNFLSEENPIHESTTKFPKFDRDYLSLELDMYQSVDYGSGVYDGGGSSPPACVLGGTRAIELHEVTIDQLISSPAALV
jgi:hypothetical protein